MFPPQLSKGQSLEQLEDPTDLVEQVHQHLVALELREYLNALPTIPQQLVRWRYGLDAQELSPAEIATRLGITRRAVYRAEQRTLRQLRRALQGEDWRAE